MRIIGEFKGFELLQRCWKIVKIGFFLCLEGRKFASSLVLSGCYSLDVMKKIATDECNQFIASIQWIKLLIFFSLATPAQR